MKATLIATFAGAMLAAAAARPADRPADAGVTLCRDGQPVAAIVVSHDTVEGADESGKPVGQPAKRKGRSPEDDAAQLLQEHLRQMSGARLELMPDQEAAQLRVVEGRIVSPPGKPAAETFVLIGESELTRGLGVDAAGLGPGGIRLKTVGNALVLVGNQKSTHASGDGGGVCHAVVTLLEELGCRYLWPGELGKVVPKRATIAVRPLDVSFTPPIGQRAIRTHGLTDRMETGLKALGISDAEWRESHGRAMETAAQVRWTAWHGLGGDLGIHGGHAFGWIWQRWGKEHPEWFALQADGTRDQGRAGGRARLCKSNPALIEAIANDILQRVKEKPDTTCVSLSPNDGGTSSFCMCAACRKLDPPNGPKIKLRIFEKAGESKRHEIDYVSLTDRMVYFWNGIAERVTKVHPRLLFVVDAYSAYSAAPVERTLHPNLVVRYVPSDAAEWDAWRSKAARIYWRPNILLRGRRTGTLCVYARSLADTFHYLAGHGTVATDFDSIIDNWAVHGLNYYVAARLNWDPHLKYDDILSDYCRSGFGKGAAEVRAYFVLAEEVWSRQQKDDEEAAFTPQAIGELRSRLAAADRAAADEPDVRARIAFLRTGLNYTDLHAALESMAADARESRPVDRAAARRLLDLNYLAMRDIAEHQHLAVNVATVAWGSGNFAKWRPLGWNGKPSAGLLERVAAAKCRLTGRENGIDDMLAAFGMAGQPR